MTIDSPKIFCVDCLVSLYHSLRVRQGIGVDIASSQHESVGNIVPIRHKSIH
jgi:hypothetical protein